MNTVQIKLYDLFRRELNLPDDKAAAFVTAVEEVVEFEVRQDSHAHSTKEDIRIIEGDIRKVELEVHKLELKLEQTKSDIYKAIFWTSLVQLIAILGGVLAIVKAMK
jgi:hypothetical protein